MHHAKGKLSLPVAATGRQAVPCDRFLKIAWDAEAAFVDESEERLCSNVAGSGALDCMSERGEVTAALKRTVGKIDVGAGCRRRGRCGWGVLRNRRRG